MKKKQVEHLEQIKFENIEIILQILGFIEAKGVLFKNDHPKITREKIEDLLIEIGHPVKLTKEENLEYLIEEDRFLMHRNYSINSVKVS
jgi:hypothetical protein